MLRKLRIERFKSIHDQTVEFGKVNLIVGPNGSGKSNLLEALGVLSAALSHGLDSTSLDLRGVRLSLPHQFKSAFKNYDLPKTFRLEALFDHGRYECSIRSSPSSATLDFFSEALYDGNVKVFGRSMHGTRLHSVADELPNFDKSSVADNRSIWNAISSVVKISDGLRRELDEFTRFAIYSPQTSIMRGQAIDQRTVAPLGLTGSGLAAAFEQVLGSSDRSFSSIIRIIWQSGWADQIRTGPFDPSIVPGHVKSEGTLLYIRDRYMKSGRNYLSAFDASEGTLYLIFVATLLAHKDTPKVFALDNVDGTLNPNLVRKLTDHVVKVCIDASGEHKKRQAFMTSHHPSSLDSFDIFDPEQRIFISNRQTEGENGHGSTFFRRFKPPKNMSKDDWLIAHQGRNLSEMLLDNRIKDAL